MRTCRADAIGPNRLVKVLENAFAEIFARRIHPVRQFVARRGAADGLAGIRQAGQRRRQLLMRRRAGNRLAGAGQRCQPCRQVYAGPVDIDAVAPRHRGVDPGAQVEMLIFRDADVLRGKCPVHLGGGIDGVGHRLETRHQAVAEALHQDAAIARQYLGSDDADESLPIGER